jgi:hypothetical protein
MTVKAPLVIGSDGLIQQLQSGDSISVAQATYSSRSVTNGEGAAAIVIGAPVYASAADTVKKAKADAKATSKLVGLGLDASVAAGGTGNIITGGVLVATTTQWDAVAGTTGGLAFNTEYFLDPATAGKITSTPPTTVGQCLVLVGIALSTTELELQIAQPILL